VHVDQSEDMVAKSSDVMSGAGLVGIGSGRLPTKSKDVNEHDLLLALRLQRELAA
jgi:hypothetical protein